jgi:2-isopropylmalate synthase
VTECHFQQVDGISTSVTIEKDNKVSVILSQGNGRLDAVSNALKSYFNISYKLSVYEEHALGEGSGTKAVSYVGLEYQGRMFWGVGMDEDIIKASIAALTVALNHVLKNR